MNFTPRAVLAVSLAVAASAALFLALLAGDGGLSAQAQTGDTPTPPPTQDDASGVQDLPPLQGKANPSKYDNMDSLLNRIVDQVDSGEFSAQTAASGAPLHQEDSVAVTLYITEGYAEAVRDFLADNGASPRNVGADYIEAYIPVSLLASASRQAGVISIRAIIPPQPAQGAVVSEGAALHGAPAWHQDGFKGAGVKIGVIDGGFEDFQRLMGTELPSSSVQARCYTDIGVFTSSISDCKDGVHGTAVTEAVFDIAPAATYYISNADTLGDLKTAVEWMVSQGVDVINQSVSWTWQGPGDGTSPFTNSVLRTVDTAVAGGSAWVNSAGNAATSTWFGGFRDADSDGFHDYASGDCNIVRLRAGGQLIVQLRWDDRWGGATTDLDLYLFNPALTDIVASSESTQAGGARHIPREVFSYTPTVSGKYCLAVRRYLGAPPAWIQLQAITQQDLQHRTSNYSIGNPAESANPGLLAVGATHWADTSAIGGLSSRGPTPDGRIKPDIVGVHCGQSAAYRSAGNPNGYFCGTSQAAPHVTGLAALVKQRFPSYSPAQVANYLKTGAEARGTVPNNTWGYGFARLPKSADRCVTPIDGDATINGAWTSDCVSESNTDGKTYYARFYTFTLDEPADVTITLTSNMDTYLYLLSGAGKDGAVAYKTDETVRTNSSRIEASLAAGDYTIEATTYDPSVTGDFTLTVEGLGQGTVTPPTPAPSPTPEPTPEPTPSPTPEPTPLPSVGYTYLAVGELHTCGLRTDGSVVCWGNNQYGQASPPSDDRFTFIVAGAYHTCGIRVDGAAVCWGRNDYGQSTPP